MLADRGAGGTLLLDGEPDRLRWREFGRDGRITFAVVDAEPPSRLVTRIVDDSLPFGGTWTYQLRPDGEGCLLTVTENGEVNNRFFRFMSRYVFGHTATIDAYLKASARGPKCPNSVRGCRRS